MRSERRVCRRSPTIFRIQKFIQIDCRLLWSVTVQIRALDRALMRRDTSHHHQHAPRLGCTSRPGGEAAALPLGRLRHRTDSDIAPRVVDNAHADARTEKCKIRSLQESLSPATRCLPCLGASSFIHGGLRLGLCIQLPSGTPWTFEFRHAQIQPSAQLPVRLSSEIRQSVSRTNCNRIGSEDPTLAQ